MVHEALGQEIFGLRASYCLKPLPPIPARSPARDDDIGGHPYRHFDRSGAEWRNLTPQWARGAADAADCVERLWKKVLKMDRPLAGGFLSLTAFQSEGCGGALRAQIL